MGLLYFLITILFLLNMYSYMNYTVILQNWKGNNIFFVTSNLQKNNIVKFSSNHDRFLLVIDFCLDQSFKVIIIFHLQNSSMLVENANMYSRTCASKIYFLKIVLKSKFCTILMVSL